MNLCYVNRCNDSAGLVFQCELSEICQFRMVRACTLKSLHLRAFHKSSLLYGTSLEYQMANMKSILPCRTITVSSKFLQCRDFAVREQDTCQSGRDQYCFVRCELKTTSMPISPRIQEREAQSVRHLMLIHPSVTTLIRGVRHELARRHERSCPQHWGAHSRLNRCSMKLATSTTSRKGTDGNTSEHF